MTDKPVLRPDRPVGEALRAFARDILTDAHAAIADPARSDAEAVHQFRRQMKRWRALLRLLGPLLGDDGRRLRDEAGDVARALGGARDAQSALDALGDLAGHGHRLPGPTVAAVRKRLAAIRQAAEATTLTADTRVRIARTLDKADAAVERWPIDRLAFGTLAERLAAGYRAARRAVPARWSPADADELHELRKRVVAHRNQMDIVEPLWPRFAKMWTGEAQRLRDRLGKHQDLLVLEALAARNQPLARWRARLAPAIDKRKAEHVAAARRMATRLFVETPKAFRRRLEAMWENGS